MVRYDESLTVRAARTLYFESNGFGADGGYGKKWVPVKIGPAEFLVRNSAGRLRSVRLHDLHHIATGYATTLEGEALIGAWELGSHCRNHVAAWILNATAFGFGIVLAPRALWNAFVRGRRSQNLYRGEWHEALLERRVGDLRHELCVDGPHGARPSDVFLFVMWLAVGLCMLAVTVALAPVLLMATLVYKLSLRGHGT